MQMKKVVILCFLALISPRSSFSQSALKRLKSLTGNNAAMEEIKFNPKPALVSWNISPQALIFSAKTKNLISAENFEATLFHLNIVYVGEFHNNLADHKIQAAVLSEMVKTHRRLVLGLEMADTLHQKTLDDYISGNISDSQFADFWNHHWGYFEDYRPILKEAKREHIRLIGLNAPPSIVHKVWKGGLKALNPSERALLPRTIGEIKNPRYYAMVKNSFGKVSPEELKRYILAMQVWNETMGSNVVKQRRLGNSVMVIAGLGHMVYGGGIPESVKARLQGQSSAVILPYPPNGGDQNESEILKTLSNPNKDESQWADFFWLLPSGN